MSNRSNWSSSSCPSLSFRVVLNCSSSTSSPHPPNPLIWPSSASQVTRPLSAHTDNMLGTLCTLITALTCKEADLLQLRPRVGFISLCVSLDSVWSCCFQVWVVWRWWHRSLLLWPWGKERQSPWTVTWGLLLAAYARWYKQIPGGVPQYVLRFYHGWSSPTMVLVSLLPNSHPLISRQQIIVWS